MENEFNFKPFDKVLVRDYQEDRWNVSLYGYYSSKDEEGESTDFVHRCCDGNYRFCIPYEGNEHLLGTTDDDVEPWKPKDGDFVVSGWEKGDKYCRWIAICRGYDNDESLYQTYAILHVGYSSDNGIKEPLEVEYDVCDGQDYTRLATEEEKQLFLSQLHEAGKDWNAEKKKIVKYRWRPKEKEYYWTIYGDGRIDRICKATESDAMHIKIGNCFRTKAEAQEMADKVKELFQRK